jgi:hypothetical protein
MLHRETLSQKTETKATDMHELGILYQQLYLRNLPAKSFVQQSSFVDNWEITAKILIMI